MMKTEYNNIGTIERGMRLGLGTLLLALVFQSGLPPYWFALTAPYPVMTAIMAWDPLYALVDALKHKFSHNAVVNGHAHA